MSTSNDSVTAGALLGSNEVLVSESLVTAEEQSVLVDWISRQNRDGKLFQNPKDAGVFSTPYCATDGTRTSFTRRTYPNGAGWKPVWVPDTSAFADPFPTEFWRIRERLVSRLGLAMLAEDPYKGAYMSRIEPGSGKHQHRDSRLHVDGEEQSLLRCNILVQKPSGGGHPIFDTHLEIDVPERGMWAFYASEVVHSATAVQGNVSRVVMSCGFLVRRVTLWERRFRVGTDVVSRYGLEDGPRARHAVAMQLRDAAVAAGVAPSRIALVDFAIRRFSEFSILQAAEQLGSPADELWSELRELQRSGLVQSQSSTQPGRGKVLVL